MGYRNVLGKQPTAFVLRGAVALLLRSCFSVRGLDRLLESLLASVKWVRNTQAAMAAGLHSPIKAGGEM